MLGLKKKAWPGNNMKHRIFGKKLGRNFNERKALWNAQVRSMFIYGKIKTTEAKAKSLAPLIEDISQKIISKPDLFARRYLYKYLQDRTWVNNVFNNFKIIFEGQKSNFTKITKIGHRFGDNSLIVELSFVKPATFSKTKIKEEKEEKTKKLIKKTSPKKAVKKEIKK